MAWVLGLILLMASCAYLVHTSVDNLIVTQSPSKLQLLVGQSAEIICSWNVCSEVKQFRVEWKKVSHVQDSVGYLTNTSKDHADSIKKNLYNKSFFTPGTRKESLELKNLAMNDSGVYLCKITVDIPVFKQALGSGTLLTVKEKNKNTQWYWWTLVTFLLLILSSCLSYYCKNQWNSKRIEPNRTDQEEKEEAEYIEMKKKAKEDEGTPSNATEWCHYSYLGFKGHSPGKKEDPTKYGQHVISSRIIESSTAKATAISVLYEPMTSFAKKPGEQRDDEVYTCVCSDSLPVLNPEPSTTAASSGAPKTPQEVLGKGRNLDCGYGQNEFSSEDTNLTQPTTQARHEHTELRGSEDVVLFRRYQLDPTHHPSKA